MAEHAGAAMLLAGALLGAAWAGAAAAAPDDDRQQALLHLLRHDCGSCHGMRMTGGLGPPLTPAALADKPVDFLVATVLHGRPGTPMPPWRGQLTDDEAAWLVDRLVEGVKP